MKKITRDFMEQGKSSNGGWSQKQIELLGVEWPPRKGWRRESEGRYISDDDHAKFLDLKDAHVKTPKTFSGDIPDDWIVMPINPSLAMLDAGWGICGTKLSSMQPNEKKITDASNAYAALLQAASRRR